MIVLAGINFWDVAITVLWVSLLILVLVILYRKLLSRLNRDTPPPEDYCVLYGLEIEPSKGTVEFYFTSEKKRNFQMIILNEAMEEIEVVCEKESNNGGNIIPFDTTKLENGSYFYCLKTDNQKTMKRMTIAN